MVLLTLVVAPVLVLPVPFVRLQLLLELQEVSKRGRPK